MDVSAKIVRIVPADRITSAPDFATPAAIIPTPAPEQLQPIRDVDSQRANRESVAPGFDAVMCDGAAENPRAGVAWQSAACTPSLLPGSWPLRPVLSFAHLDFEFLPWTMKFAVTPNRPKLTLDLSRASGLLVQLRISPPSLLGRQ